MFLVVVVLGVMVVVGVVAVVVVVMVVVVVVVVLVVLLLLLLLRFVDALGGTGVVSSSYFFSSAMIARMSAGLPMHMDIAFHLFLLAASFSICA